MHEIVILIAKYAIAIPVIALAYIFFTATKRARLELVVFLVISGVIALVLMKIASMLHQDPRPFVRDGVTPYFAHARDNGFPSDHTTFSALIAFVVLRYSRKLGLGLAVVALIIGASRVIAGVHHGQDIVAGFLIAALGTAIGFYLLPFAMRFLSRETPAHDE